MNVDEAYQYLIEKAKHYPDIFDLARSNAKSHTYALHVTDAIRHMSVDLSCDKCHYRMSSLSGTLDSYAQYTLNINYSLYVCKFDFVKQENDVYYLVCKYEPLQGTTKVILDDAFESVLQTYDKMLRRQAQLKEQELVKEIEDL